MIGAKTETEVAHFARFKTATFLQSSILDEGIDV
jgi:hypothetical protein